MSGFQQYIDDQTGKLILVPTGLVDVTDAATVNFDWHESKKQRVEIAADRTFTFSNLLDGFVLLVKQGTGGGHVPVWPTSIKWPDNGTTPELSTTQGLTDTFVFIRISPTLVNGYLVGKGTEE